MRISDWSSDVCSSDLALVAGGKPRDAHGHVGHVERAGHSIENADGDEEDRRSDQIDDDVLDARLQPLLSLTVQDQPIGGDQQHLEKDEEVEQVARQKCAVQPQQLKLEERVEMPAAPDRKSTRLNSSH